ncbi:alpha-(1,3)-fucosyltransferase C-like [Patella vulgata]|uniref:alpha-(1,3)-fucosyltransferase C-like n=1 Tax=Patella vulgata TaxID=6465 RepID=UPI0024A8AECB|nr:alpha-(1,3)-fucosyltransferase C-like [Patella vulgata]
MNPHCFMTTNTKYMKEAAAVLFNAQIMQIPKPMSRPDPKQIWILHDTEPEKPDWSHNVAFRKPEWRDLFNWTMFYREDSDIFAPYGIVRKKTPSELFNRDLDSLVKSKTKNVAWMVSHCTTQGKRVEYVRLLQKYIDIDIYGNCSLLQWPRNLDKEFMLMINSTYKFYLAFENSFCVDYITEKFYRYYNGDYILVARGGGNYTKYIPAGTFIDTRDFNSTKDLTDHLHYLSTNHEAYMKILRKKDLYISVYERLDTVENNDIVFIHYQYETPALCEICYRINNLQIYSKTIARVDEWFDEKLCYPPKDLNCFNNECY